MQSDKTEYEKARQDTYTPLVERIHPKWSDRVFIFAISCGLGWKDIIFKLVDDLDRVWEGYRGKKGSENWQLCQAKEKFGGLRFYVEYSNYEGEDAKDRYEKAAEMISHAAAESFKTCERCGKEGSLVTVWHYGATVCSECEARWRDRFEKGLWPALFG